MTRIYGDSGRIAHVDLTNATVVDERPDEAFNRTYAGGSAVGAYYLLKLQTRGAALLGPDNVLIFAPSVLTGAPISGLSRFTITAKSPLTGAVGDAQCGGHWGPHLKFAGFDAVVVTGRSESPVYLWISDGRIEIRDATRLVELTTKQVEAEIRRELGDERIEVVQNGPAGRRLVRYANLCQGLHHFGGCTGMGAVMGAKNLVALAARGKRGYAFFDEAGVKAQARRAMAKYKDSPACLLSPRPGRSPSSKAPTNTPLA